MKYTSLYFTPLAIAFLGLMFAGMLIYAGRAQAIQHEGTAPPSAPAAPPAQTAQTATTTAVSTEGRAPTCSLEVIPSAVVPGGSAMLHWTSEFAEGVVFNGVSGLTGAFPPVGVQTVSPSATATYTGTFVGAGGTATCSATLIVSGGIGEPGVFDRDITMFETPTHQPATTDVFVSTTTTGTETLTPPATGGALPGLAGPLENTPAPAIVDIDENGGALIRGIVLASGSNTLTLMTWGGEWTVQTTGLTTVAPEGVTQGDVSAIPAGNFVGVLGSVAPETAFTVDARFVRDWTRSPIVETETFGTTSESEAATNASSSDSSGAGVPPLFTGTVRATGENSFTLLTDSGVEYTVNLAEDAIVWNEARNNIDFSQIKAGNPIRLNGTLGTDGTITATVVRDISL